MLFSDTMIGMEYIGPKAVDGDCEWAIIVFERERERQASIINKLIRVLMISGTPTI